MKNSRKAIIASPLILSALLLAGCSGTGSSGSSATSTAPGTGAAAVPAAALDNAAADLLPPDIKSAGKIVAVTNAGYPPYEMYDTDNTTIIGRDVDFAKALGEVLGVQIEFDNVSFDSIIPGIDAGRYQIAISGLTVTPDRLAAADFVSYSKSGSNIAVPAGNPKGLKVSDAMTLCGMTIGVTKGSSQALVDLPGLNQQCLDAGKAAITASEFADEGSRLALSSGRVDAILDDSLSLAYGAQQSDGAYELGPGADISAASSGIALEKGSDLTPAIAAAVKTLVSTQADIYKDINVKWGIPAENILSVDEVDNN